MPVGLNLVVDITADDLMKEPIRLGFGRGLLLAGQDNEQVVAVCADLTDSTQMSLFKNAFPERFVQVGVAEQDLVTVGSGLAAMGKIPFVSSYAVFSPGRNWEQIRTTVCINNQPVKIIGSHTGINVGPDGATHQMLEDLALMRVLPNMVVIAPADSLEAQRATIAMAHDERPNYMRLATNKTPFQIGRAYIYAEGKDISLIATGTMTFHALIAAQLLEQDSISAEVIHVPTVKPLDNEVILDSVRKTKAVITIEEGQINGGLGGAIAELLSEEEPTKLKRIGMNDHFGESGRADELMSHFSLDAAHIRMAAHLLLS
jgi:transketolase